MYVCMYDMQLGISSFHSCPDKYIDIVVFLGQVFNGSSLEEVSGSIRRRLCGIMSVCPPSLRVGKIAGSQVSHVRLFAWCEDEARYVLYV